jgi:hypothetical protein
LFGRQGFLGMSSGTAFAAQQTPLIFARGWMWSNSTTKVIHSQFNKL